MAATAELRAAAERIERAVDCYGKGDLAGAATELEAALAACPSSRRGRHLLAWVRDLQSGKRNLHGKPDGALDDDALQALDEALAAPGVDTPELASTADLPPESAWDPVPLTPTGATILGMPALATPASPTSEWPTPPPDDDDDDEETEVANPPTDPFIRPSSLQPPVPERDEYDAYTVEETQPGVGPSAARSGIAIEEARPVGDTAPLEALPDNQFGLAEAALRTGDLVAAIDACEAALAEAEAAGNRVEPEQVELCERIYGAILGGPARVPLHGTGVANLDPRAAFLLSRVDGQLTVEDVLDVSGMARAEALRMLGVLVRRGAVVIK